MIHPHLFRVLLTAAVAALAVTGGHAQAPPAGGGRSLPFPDLVGGLKTTPGCLGVETARTQTGKDVIFAWFENKEAVLNWYHSDMHQGVMRKFFPSGGYRKPLEGVPDGTGPIMAIASITMSDKPQLGETDLPISQIAIELYQPVTGGLYLGGRFAPEGMKVPRMKDYTPKTKP